MEFFVPTHIHLIEQVKGLNKVVFRTSRAPTEFDSERYFSSVAEALGELYKAFEDPSVKRLWVAAQREDGHLAGLEAALALLQKRRQHKKEAFDSSWARVYTFYFDGTPADDAGGEVRPLRQISPQ